MTTTAKRSRQPRLTCKPHRPRSTSSVRSAASPPPMLLRLPPPSVRLTQRVSAPPPITGASASSPRPEASRAARAPRRALPQYAPPPGPLCRRPRRPALAEMPMSNGTALIIGGGPGISASCARLFAKNSLKVAVAARTPDKPVRRELRDDQGFLLSAADAADPADMEGLFADVARDLDAPTSANSPSM